MRWQKALDQALSRARDRRTEYRRWAYQFDPSKKLSRLYGFRLVGPDAAVEPVPEEIAVVKEVITAFADGLSAEAVKERLDSRGVLNRSQKRFSKGELIGLVREIYSGYVKGPLGTRRRSTIYPPVVSRKMWAQAAKNVSEGREIEFFESRQTPVTIVAPDLPQKDTDPFTCVDPGRYRHLRSRAPVPEESLSLPFEVIQCWRSRLDQNTDDSLAMVLAIASSELSS